jgi:hypothetical protein
VDEVSTEYLTDHPDHVSLIAGSHAGRPPAGEDLDFWIRAHETEANGRDVPTAWTYRR